MLARFGKGPRPFFSTFYDSRNQIDPRVATLGGGQRGLERE